MEARLTAEAESIQRTLEFPINVQFIAGESKLLTVGSLCPLVGCHAHARVLATFYLCLFDMEASTPEVYLNFLCCTRGI